MIRFKLNGDIPGDRLYTAKLDRSGKVMKDKYGIEMLWCSRGTNKVEALHKPEEALVGQTARGPQQVPQLLSLSQQLPEDAPRPTIGGVPMAVDLGLLGLMRRRGERGSDRSKRKKRTCGICRQSTCMGKTNRMRCPYCEVCMRLNCPHKNDKELCPNRHHQLQGIDL